MKNIDKIIGIILIIFFVFSCNNGSSSKNKVSNNTTNNTPLGQAGVIDNVSDPNILQVAINSKDHSILVTAVQAAHIEHVLVNAGPLTVFAPINSAFEVLPDGTLDELLKPEKIDDLTSILLRHSAPGAYSPTILKNEIKKGRKLYMANGDYLSISQNNEEIFINESKIIHSITTSNGIINIIDKLIL